MNTAPTAASLASRFKSTALWTTLNHVATQLLRLGSNLLLAKLLAPDLFGVMSLAYTVLYGLYMLTDSGVATVGIQSPRGAEPRFLNVLWTLETARGSLVSLFACGLAGLLWFIQTHTHWLTSSTYADARLPLVLAAVGLCAVPQGLESTKKILARRHLQAALITRIELESQLLTVAAMLTWAALSPTIWALALPPLLGALYKTVVTHLRLEGPINRFEWDTGVAREVMHIGQWVFLSSIITFLINSVDKIFLGAVLSASALGHYSIAFVLATAVHSVCAMLSAHAFTPAFSEIQRDRPTDLPGIVQRAKRLTTVGCVLAALFTSVAAGPLIDFMYDQRYHEVAWMLAILSFTLVATPASVVDSALIAQGSTRALASMNALRLLAACTCLGLGYAIAGSEGAVVGVSGSAAVSAIVSSRAQVQAGLTSWSKELRLYALWIAVSALALGVHHLL